MKPVRAWGIVLKGELVIDSDGVVAVYASKRVARDARATTDELREEPVRVEVRAVPPRRRRASPVRLDDTGAGETR